MEFAKDVEIQTTELGTTQKNLVAYIDRVWNTPHMLREWGQPVCVISAGIHDAGIKNITTWSYLQNVQELLIDFGGVCQHIVWLGNSAPKGNPIHPQRFDLMKDWDEKVKSMVEGKFRTNVTFVDVFDASAGYPHMDNVHMENSWYQQLGESVFLASINAR